MNNKQLKDLIKQEYNSIEMKPDVNKLQEQLYYVNQNEKVIEKKKRISLKPFIQLATICMCVFCFYLMKDREEYNVSLDVNPSIELKVNNKERVTKVICHNQEAIDILGDMDLENTDVHVSLNAILGRMVGEGYITREKNSILISVDGKNEKERKEMKDKLKKDIEITLQNYQVDSDILSYDFKSTNDIEKIAKKYNISQGKAKVIQQIVEEDPTFKLEDLAQLPIEYINMLMHYKNKDFSSISLDGIDIRNGYIHQDEVQDILIKEIYLDKQKIKDYKIHLIAHDNNLVYDTTFIYENIQYHYQVHALSGTIKDQ